MLHSIKTLAAEMAEAMCEGQWDYLGEPPGPPLAAEPGAGPQHHEHADRGL